MAIRAGAEARVGLGTVVGGADSVPGRNQTEPAQRHQVRVDLECLEPVGRATLLLRNCSGIEARDLDLVR